RRVGSSIVAGEATARKMLGLREGLDEEGEGESEDEQNPLGQTSASALYPLQPDERGELQRFLDLIQGRQGDDPKWRGALKILREGTQDTPPWFQEGCILFSQYYDTARW